MLPGASDLLEQHRTYIPGLAELGTMKRTWKIWAGKFKEIIERITWRKRNTGIKSVKEICETYKKEKSHSKLIIIIIIIIIIIYIYIYIYINIVELLQTCLSVWQNVWLSESLSRFRIVIYNNLYQYPSIYLSLPIPLLGQDMTQGQFLSGV